MEGFPPKRLEDGGVTIEVRRSEERSDELKNDISIDQNHTSSYKTHLPRNTLIILTHNPNPFGDSLRSSQNAGLKGGQVTMKIV